MSGLVDVVDGRFGPDTHYVLVDYAVRWVAGEPVAGDDAADAAFLPVAEIGRFAMWSETERIIRLAVERFGE